MAGAEWNIETTPTFEWMRHRLHLNRGALFLRQVKGTRIET
jgi:hypothetical protein